jgi:hypothetical protein
MKYKYFKRLKFKAHYVHAPTGLTYCKIEHAHHSRHLREYDSPGDRAICGNCLALSRFPPYSLQSSSSDVRSTDSFPHRSTTQVSIK